MTDQLTRDELAALTAAHRYEDIEQARQAGRLDLILGISETDVDVLHRARHDAIDVEDVKSLTRLGRHDLIEAARTEDRITYPNQES